MRRARAAAARVVSAVAREVWRHAEPYHALTYFAPEAHAAYEGAGLRGFWRGYFAGRAAPLGPVGAGAVTAAFYGFHPAFVGRAIPAVWSTVTPEAAVEARNRGVDDALGRIFGDDLPHVAAREAARRLRGALEGCDSAGRPLFAANLDVEWPAGPGVALWHAVTLLREHRGDGHVAALTVSAIDPCEAHVTQVAASGATLETIRPYRGWADEDWAAAIGRLEHRGWIDGDGQLTAAGRDARARVEDDTDRLAAAPVERLGADGIEAVLDVVAPLSARLVESAVIPYPNPIGVPVPEPR